MIEEKSIAPNISVIMAVYNEPLEWICQSVNSILNQTYSNFEFIIINDNPLNDDTVNLLKSFAKNDDRIILVFNDKNIGLTKSLNKGLKLARGKYIARMDADDESLPCRFAKQVAYLEKHPNLVLLGGNVKYFGKRAFLHFDDMVKYDNDSIKAELLMRNCIIHSTVFIRKKVLNENNVTYDENFRQSQDYRLWELLYDCGEFENLNEVLLKYRYSSQQITSKFKSNQYDLAASVAIHLQKKWLESYGIKATEDELKNNPFDILFEAKKKIESKNTKKYRVFVQYCYLRGQMKFEYMKLFLKEDWKCFTFYNLFRLFLRIFSKM